MVKMAPTWFSTAGIDAAHWSMNVAWSEKIAAIAPVGELDFSRADISAMSAQTSD